MATPGTFISGFGHVGLIGWLIIGWGFDADPFEMQTMDVSVISGEEFEQMRARSAPDPGDADPDAPLPPELDETPPPAPAREVPPVAQTPPAPVTPPVNETPPAPPPEPVVTEAEDQPPPAPAVPETPPAPELDISPEPSAPQAPTVASTITAPPPPDANTDDIVRDVLVPNETVEAEVVQEEQDATAPEETTTEIVIEDLAPARSIRPTARPSRPAPEPEPEVDVATDAPATEPVDTDAEALAAALATATAEPAAPAVAQGPPMTGSERDSFRIAVNRCWNVDPGSVASRVIVEVGFSLERDGSVRGNEVRLLSSSGDQSAVNTAFEAARRAVLRCQSGGYQLPAEKYEQWKEAVIVFDPSGMRLR